MTDELKNFEEKAQEYDASQIQVLEGLQPLKRACIIWYGK